MPDVEYGIHTKHKHKHHQESTFAHTAEQQCQPKHSISRLAMSAELAGAGGGARERLLRSFRMTAHCLCRDPHPLLMFFPSKMVGTSWSPIFVGRRGTLPVVVEGCQKQLLQVSPSSSGALTCFALAGCRTWSHPWLPDADEVAGGDAELVAGLKSSGHHGLL